MYKEISHCRICGNSRLEVVFDLGRQALTGVFPKTRRETVKGGPVELVRCVGDGGCGLVQLRQSYDLADMYGMNYGYRSGLNASMAAHLRSKVGAITARTQLSSGDLVVDIGSNDCTTLKYYPQAGLELVGVDPTGAKFREYYPPSVKLVPDFFSAEAVRLVVGDKKAKVITSFSMFYDLEDPVSFASEVASMLADDGVWVFEQSYLPAMLSANSFDTICHEHLEFYSLRQIDWIARHSGLKVLDVEFNSVNGGSFSVTAAKAGSIHEPNIEKLEAIASAEEALNLATSEPYARFSERVQSQRAEFMKFLNVAKSDGKIVCGLGASTKGNVLLQYYNIGPDLMSAIGEVNADKYGSFTPGSGIPIISQSEVVARSPDYLVVLPWHFRSFFESLDVLKGQTLVFPLPVLDIVQL